jgi:hypothetical protein
LLPNVNLQGKDVTNVASNRWEDSSTRYKSVVEIGKLPNVKRVRHEKNTAVDNVTDLKTNQPVCIKENESGRIFTSWHGRYLNKHIIYTSTYSK